MRGRVRVSQNLEARRLWRLIPCDQSPKHFPSSLPPHPSYINIMPVVKGGVWTNIEDEILKVSARAA